MVFVVIIHNGLTEKDFAIRGITAAIPNYVENVQRLIGIVAAIAVPLFFVISAYLLYTKEQAFLPVLKKKCRTIAAPYLL
jgi:surface polysaccharide O-acyltransferase-like enzyme